MDENKLRKIVKEVVDEAVNPIKEQLHGVVTRLDDPDTGLAAINRRLDDPDTGLAAINRRLDDPDTGLAAINRRLDANTGAVIDLERRVKGYADMYKINDFNIRRMQKRLETLEEKAEVDVPSELKLEPFSEPLAEAA